MNARGDVCSFSSPVAVRARGADGMMFIPPNHPFIRYIGRIHADPDGPSFALPATSIRLAFEGARIDFELEDFGGGTEMTTNYYAIAIDDRAPTVLKAIPGRHRYEFGGLDGGPHEIEIFKETESSPGDVQGAGRGIFRGFFVNEASAISAPRARPHHIEFIGDSITAGYGARVSTHDPAEYPFTTANSNAWLSWGAVAARTLDAEYVGVAYSARGVYRNYASRAGARLPELYRTIVPGESAMEWDPRRFIPDAIVIGLGTNDFSTVDTDIVDCVARGIAGEACLSAMLDAAHEQFRAVYFGFLELVRGYYPEAAIFLATSPMLDDVWPAWNAGTDDQPRMLPAEAASRLRADLRMLQALCAKRGDLDVFIVEVPHQRAPFGADWHPTAATQQANGELVARCIAEKLGWRLDLRSGAAPRGRVPGP